MKFLRDWLSVQRPAGVAPHASQTIDLDLSYDAAFERCVRGVEDVLGGIVRERDPRTGVVEATFGLVNSERLSCSLEPLDENRTRITMTGRRGASAEPAKPSQYVNALAQFLQSNAR